MADQPTRSSPGTAASLTVRAGPMAGTAVPIGHDVIVGRGTRSDVVVDDDSVSTEHARLLHDQDSWWITDLGSANGTFVNGTRVPANERVRLSIGDLVRLGAVEAEFTAGAAAGAPAAGAAARERPPRVADRRAGFRLPLWVLVVAMLLALAAWYLLQGTPEPAPVADPAVVLESAPVGADDAPQPADPSDSVGATPASDLPTP